MYNYDYDWLVLSTEQLEEYFLEETKAMDADRLDYLESLTEDYDEFCNSFYEGLSLS